MLILLLQNGRFNWFAFYWLGDGAYLTVPENLWRDPSSGVGDCKDDDSVHSAEEEGKHCVAVVPQDQERNQGSLRFENLMFIH